ncbi:DUF3489 domain-containing protein [Sphingorhabdus arenilitoris]|uniref:DUF3489 domain-containing protein n=1 Tax=Sphingorhabdus arenilitoris TaxID=1490041 RepID=A0ABV8RER2_9SPHN
MAKAATTKPDLNDVIKDVRAPKPQSKLDCLLRLLLQHDGACLDEMMEATGWQPHTVRASMTALRGRGYDIDKRMGGNVTVWFIDAGEAQ